MNERFAQIEPFVIQRAANRLISFFIALVFLTTSATEHGLLWAQGVPSLGGAELQGAGLYSQAGFTVPADLGVLREYRAASNADAPFVIHIQDAHANVDAQKSIQGLLGWLSRQPEGERMTVYLEGASGSIHPEYLRLFGEYPEINEAVVQDLASKGELNGVELYAWEGFKKGLTAEAFRVEGVEQADLYRDNLTTYREILARQDSIAGLLSPLNKKLELAESRILSAELREFFKERSRRKLGQYENGSGSPQLGAYLSYLAGTVKKELQIDLDERIEQVRFPNLVRLLVLEQIEKKADRAASERERTKVMEMLRVHAGTEEERTLLENFERMDASMDARGIAEKLWAFAASRGVDLKGYTQMWKSAGAVVLRSEIESEGLFAEMDTLESALIEKWIRSEQERKLVGMLRDTELIEKLLALKWTPKDESQYLSRPQDILENVFGTELDKLLNESSEPDVAKRLTLDIQGLRREVDSALHFYETARDRDAIILDRTLAPGQEGRLKVLVSGGFHTTGLTQLLREQGAGYAVVQP
ncbi:MAG: hypothetical protein FGM27_09575, partial [Candidatus Omnitrophica bacterium]|nr:hypothetical protein [Candidatus Omnitrophota bacterium]